jgi:putative ABC transport system permease protein
VLSRAWRLGWRQARRKPFTSAVAVLILAFGATAMTMVVSLRTALLGPLDYPRPAELVRLYETHETLRDSANPRLAAMWNRVPVAYQNVVDWRAKASAFAAIGLYQSYSATLVVANEEPRQIEAGRLDADLLATLAVAPQLGRPFRPEETHRREPLALLGHELWASVFNADPRLVGRAIELDGQPHTIVGVMPAGFAIAGRQDRLWTPLGPSPADLAARNEQAYAAIGRLAPGASLAAARAQLETVAAGLATAHPETNRGASVRLVPWLDVVVGESRPLLRLLTLATALLAATVCVNLALLWLALDAGREPEVALRTSLGALPRRLLVERASRLLPLALVGGVAAWGLAALGGRLVPWLFAGELPRLERLRFDGQALGLALAAALVTTAAAVLLSLLGAPRRALAPALGRAPRTGQPLLVIAQLALGLVLLALALAVARDWRTLAVVPPGFEPRGVLVQELRIPAWLYPLDARRRELGDRLLDALEALPGVERAALTSRLPAPGPAEVWGFRIAGEPAATGTGWTQGRSAVMQAVSPGYLDVLRLPLRAGDDFATAASADGGLVVLVNRTLAERDWPGRSPLGAELEMGGARYRVVGVVEDLRSQGLAEAPGELLLQPWSQRPTSVAWALVRTVQDPLALAPSVRRTLRQLEPTMPLPPATTLEAVVSGSLAGPRARTLLLGSASGCTLLLALVGLYGVTAAHLARERGAIAVRLALGATPAAIVRATLGRTLGLAGAGALLGVLATGLGKGALARALPEVPAVSQGTLGLAVALLIGVSLLAASGPAWQASRLDPAVALRQD